MNALSIITSIIELTACATFIALLTVVAAAISIAPATLSMIFREAIRRIIEITTHSAHEIGSTAIALMIGYVIVVAALTCLHKTLY